MRAVDRYSSPAAFRRALTDRLKEAAQTSRWNVQQLQRQVAYDRLLERLYLVDEGWIVKGATALLARDLGVRGSLDVDVCCALAQGVAEADLRRAADLDLGDWFRFELRAPVPIGKKGVRVSVYATIGDTTWVEFRVDISGADLQMTGQPDDVPPIARGLIPEVDQRGYRVYPLVDHVADKVAATYELHGPSGYPSTRFRDLVDLVAIASRASLEGAALRIAIHSEFSRRGLKIPAEFDVPDRALWESGYSAAARDSLLTFALTLDDAIAVVRALIDPVLRGTALGVWMPNEGEWSGLLSL